MAEDRQELQEREARKAEQEERVPRQINWADEIGWIGKKFTPKVGIRNRIAERLRELAEEGRPAQYKVEQSTYAVDLMDSRCGKDLAAKQAISWFALLGEPISSEELVLAFGDNRRDMAMASRAREMGYSVLYFNVGRPLEPEENAGFKFFQSKSYFSQGTEEILSQFDSLKLHSL